MRKSMLRYIPSWVIRPARAALRRAGLCAFALRRGGISRVSSVSEKDARAFCQAYSACPPQTSLAERSPDADLDLSVIVPVYNARSFVTGCLDSIFSQQTDFRYEVLAIDDCSTDDSAAILGGVRDDRLRVLSRAVNGGSARARNDGLNSARGRYLMFADADDRLLPGAIETLLSAAKREGADVVQGQYVYFVNDVQEAVPAPRCPVRVLAGNDPAICDYPGVPWMKVFDRALWLNVNFLEGDIYEDTVIWYLVFPRARAFVCVPENVYAYRENAAGITARNKSKPKAADAYWAVEESLRLRAAAGLAADETAYRMTLIQFSSLLYSRNAAAGDETLENLFALAAARTIALRAALVHPPIVRDAYLRRVEDALLARDFGAWRYLSGRMV